MEGRKDYNKNKKLPLGSFLFLVSTRYYGIVLTNCTKRRSGVHIKKSIQCTTEPLNDLISEGTNIDFRLNEAKWQDLKPGDHIEYWEDFTGWQTAPTKDSRTVIVRIEHIYKAKTFNELIDLIDEAEFMLCEKESILKSLRRWWSKEQELENGVLGFSVIVV